jgi:hypothetical protein
MAPVNHISANGLPNKNRNSLLSMLICQAFSESTANRRQKSNSNGKIKKSPEQIRYL